MKYSKYFDSKDWVEVMHVLAYAKAYLSLAQLGKGRSNYPADPTTSPLLDSATFCFTAFKSFTSIASPVFRRHSANAPNLYSSIPVFHNGLFSRLFAREHDQTEQWHPNAPHPPRRLHDLWPRDQHCSDPRARSRIPRIRLRRMVRQRKRSRFSNL